MKDLRNLLKSKGITGFKAQKIIQQGGKCSLCGQPLDLNDPKSINIDHTIPISRGGHKWKHKNRTAAHRHCNSIKGNMMPHKWESTGIRKQAKKNA